MRQLKITKTIVHRSEESLEKYFLEIGRIPMLTVDEEALLALSIHEGGKKGEAAKNKLVTANLRFVVSIAKQYQNLGLSLSDLINEGNIGLIKAAERYDETRGFKFISYAIWWIRQSILHAIETHGNAVRRSQGVIAIGNKVIKSGYATDSLLNHDSMCHDLLQVLCSTLNDRERTIIIQSFGIGCQEESLDTIAQGLRLTRERVRQIREQSIRKLRKSSNSRQLHKHLG